MNESTYFELLGCHIQKFINDRWKTQKKAAQMLDVTPNRISEMINGTRPANQRTILKLQRFGFDILHFERWYGVSEIEPDNLNKKEIIALVAEMKLVINRQSEIIQILNEQIKRLTLGN